MCKWRWRWWLRWFWGGCEGGLAQFGSAVGWSVCINVVVANGVGISVGGGGAGNRRSAVMIGGGRACASSGGVS